MESKIRYLWYSDVANIVRKFSTQQPDKINLSEAIEAALHHPKVKPE